MYYIIVFFAKFLAQPNCGISSVSQATLKFDEIVSSLLSEEMRQKNMDIHSMDACLWEVALGRETKIMDQRSNKGRSKSQGKCISKCWKCDKDGNYKKDCKCKNVEKAKGSEDTPST